MDFRTSGSILTLLLLAPLARGTALDRWQDAVRARAPKTTRLPYPMSADYVARFLRLPYLVSAYPKAWVYLAYLDRPRSIAPVTRRLESWHAEIRYLEGYNYVVSFADEGERREFLAACPDVQIADGELDGRYTVTLTPKQFFAMSQSHEIRGPMVERDGVRESTWSELKRLGWAPPTGGDLRYFFDDHGGVVGLRRGRQFYAVVPRAETRRRTAASHLEILRAQNPALDLSRFLGPDGEIPEDSGLGAARRETAAVERALERHYDRPDFAGAAALGRDLRAGVLAAEAFGAPAEAFTLLRWTSHRLESLRWIEGTRERGLAQDLGRAPELASAGPRGATEVRRFVWVRDLDLGAGLLVSRRGQLIHEQMLELALGRPVVEKLLRLDGVRGGTLAIRFDEAGRPRKFWVDRGEMLVLDPAGRAHALTMTSAERQTLALELFNSCQENLR